MRRILPIYGVLADVVVNVLSSEANKFEPTSVRDTPLGAGRTTVPLNLVRIVFSPSVPEVLSSFGDVQMQHSGQTSNFALTRATLQKHKRGSPRLRRDVLLFWVPIPEPAVL